MGYFIGMFIMFVNGRSANSAPSINKVTKLIHKWFKDTPFSSSFFSLRRRKVNDLVFPHSLHSLIWLLCRSTYYHSYLIFNPKGIITTFILNTILVEKTSKWKELASIKYLCVKISNQFYLYYLNLFNLLLMVLVVLWLI